MRRRSRSEPKACTKTRAFVVIGRIIYEYEQGGWNEWHIVYNDGTNGWLSDAQLEYDLSWQATPPGRLCLAPGEIRRGQSVPVERQELTT